MFDPVDDKDNYKWNCFYYNRKDKRILVPKKMRFLGWSLNFAHKESYIWLLLLLTACFILSL